MKLRELNSIGYRDWRCLAASRASAWEKWARPSFPRWEGLRKNRGGRGREEKSQTSQPLRRATSANSPLSESRSGAGDQSCPSGG